MKPNWSDDISEVTLPTSRGWLTVGPYSVWVKKTDAGLILEVYGLGMEAYDALVTCQTSDADIPEDEEDE